jgi:predicted metalloendopeptidase
MFWCAGGAAALLLAACMGGPSGVDSTQPNSKPMSTKMTNSGVLTRNLDPAVRAQDDFYRHVNGQWLTVTQIPSDRSNYGAFTLLEDGAEHNLHEILEQASTRVDTKVDTGADLAPGTDDQKVGDFYASFMDEAKIEAKGLAPLKDEFARIGAIASKRDVARYIGHAQRIGVAQPFAFFVAIDDRHSSQYLGVVTQTGLGMPDRDYYLSEDAKLRAVRDKYRTYMKDILAAADTPAPARAADRIFALELRLASAHWTRVQNRDAEKTYNRRDLAALAELTPAFDWNAFLAGAQVPAGKVTALNVTQPSYFAALSQAVTEVPVEDWRTYFRYKLLRAYAADLPARFVQLDFDFNQRTVSGIEQMKPRWKRGVDTVENAVGDLAGKMYVERHFSADSKRRVEMLVDNLKKAYAQGIDELEWMTPATKARAHAKLDLFSTKIGYPSKWRDWSSLVVKRDDLVGNEIRATAVAFDRGIAKLGGPIDKTEWSMTPQTVNAYYNSTANEVVFPAAILQPPFFDASADDAVNYGGIGAVIGHEISHGFDDQGRRYDGTGNLNDWWAPQDSEEFMRRAKALGAQYSALSPIAGLHVNGELTMGENIADLAGLAMAYRAYHLSLNGRQAPVLDGLTGDQRFFIGWAQVWARKYREDELRKRLLTDPHSPGEYRANAIVANLPQFYAAFGVKPGDKMYRAPQDRVRIW